MTLMRNSNLVGGSLLEVRTLFLANPGGAAGVAVAGGRLQASVGLVPWDPLAGGGVGC